MKDHPKWQRQMELETLARDRGMARYTRAVQAAEDRDDAASTGAAHALLKKIIEPTADAIQEAIEASNKGYPGSFHASAKMIGNLDPAFLAYLTARVALGVTRRQRGLTQLAAMVGRVVEDEVRTDAFAQTHSALLRTIMEDLNKRGSNDAWKRTVVIHTMNKKGFDWESWSRADQIRVGSLLLYAFMGSTGLLETFTTTRGRHRQLQVRLTDAIYGWLNHANSYRAMLSPVFMPTIIPPKPWEGLTGGGYWSDMVRPIRLVRSVPTDALKDADLSEVYSAVNRVQETPWRINPKVLETIQTVWDHGLDLPILPPRDPKPLPAKPVDIDTNPDAKTDWKRRAGTVYRENAVSRSERLQVAVSLSIADQLAGEEAIYFPHNLDFRGRLYPIPVTLNPQGPDYVRGLLEFAETKPINDWTAAGWLAIHGANLFGVDKISLEDRISWVEDHNEDIQAAAADPLANGWWMEADKPWQFLAFCLEWSEFLAHGLGYQSRLPVVVDGTCNGLQHYSAMLRDPIGGLATNLMPTPEPQDIYQQVADRTLEKLAASDSMFAARWASSSLIDRKVTKRPVMVLPYGGTLQAAVSYVGEAVRKKWAEGAPNPFHPDEEYAAVRFLAKTVWSGISEVVIAARAGMDWLKKVARLVAKEGVTITWTAPSGFKVQQYYPTMKQSKVKTYFNGSIHNLSYRTPKATHDPHRNANGIAPNFVHSMDAAALMDTVNLAAHNGVDHFVAIHDAYGTHAADMAALSAVLRHSFVEMYENNDVLEQFRQQVMEQLPPEARKKVPPLPKSGLLDIRQVLESDFFFA